MYSPSPETTARAMRENQDSASANSEKPHQQPKEELALDHYEGRCRAVLTLLCHIMFDRHVEP